MKTVKIGFSKPQHKIFPIYSYAIRLMDQTPYSHVYLKFHSASINRDITYQAAGHSVQFVSTSNWRKTALEIDSFDISITEEQYTMLMQFCIDNANVSYGIKQVFGIFLSKVFKLQHNPFKSGLDTEVCSELIGRILFELGYTITKDFDLLSPKDIHNILTKSLN